MDALTLRDHLQSGEAMIPEAWAALGEHLGLNEAHTARPPAAAGYTAAHEGEHLRSLLAEALTTMRHAEVFIRSREKMHPTGQKLYADLLERMAAV